MKEFFFLFFLNGKATLYIKPLHEYTSTKLREVSLLVFYTFCNGNVLANCAFDHFI